MSQSEDRPFEKDETLIISRASNGYMARPDSPHIRSTEPRTMVFQSAHALLQFLADHFTHRAESVPTDPAKDSK